MNYQHGIKPLLITLLLCCTAPLSAADPEPAAEPAAKPVPWHVSNAEIRVPVKVAMKGALLRMPPQVYIADLKPLKTSGGLAFNPKTKSALHRDLRKPQEKAAAIAKEKERYKKAKMTWDPKAYYRLGEKEGGPILRVSGSVTVAIRPEYKYFSWGPSGAAKVTIDGKLLPEDSLLQVTWKEGEPVRGTYKERTQTRLAPIPPGAKTLKLEMNTGARGVLSQAGFITRSPGVARASICLPGHDPSKLVPVVHRASGERVGCRTVWAEAGKPMSIFFDSSSGDEDYWVYLVDQAKQPAPLDWVPQAGLIEEVRSLDRYDPKLETLDGFLKLWEGSGAIMGRGVPLNGDRQAGPSRPARVIYRGFMPFRSKGSDRLNVRQALASRPAWFSRLSGTFQIPETDRYRFVCMCGPAGYVLLDGQLVAPFLGKVRARFFEIELEKGRHRIEFLQYAHAGQNGGAGLWWKDPRRKDLHGDYEIGWPKFGDMIAGAHERTPSLMMWEPMADATCGPLETSRGQASWASFSWYQHAHLGAVSPGHDLNWYRFSAHAPGGSANAVYRWRFDDSRTAEGKQIMKLFLRSGMRKVQLEVLDAPGGKVIARAAGEVNVQINLAYTKDFRFKGRGDMVAMIWAFAEEETLAQLPLDDLVNLFEWSYPLKHWGASRKVASGNSPNGHFGHSMCGLPYVEARELAGRRIRDGLARRVDELIGAYPYSELLRIAQSLSRKENSPTDASYAAAEKLLAVVMDRSPAGSSHWRASALGLADIKLLVRGEAELTVALLKKIEQIDAAVDMLEPWQFAKASEYHPLLAREKLAGLTQGLDWSPLSWLFRWEYKRGLSIRYNNHKVLLVSFEDGHGFWLTKTFDLPAGWKGKQLMFKTVLIHPNGGPPLIENVWINGEPLGRMWQWPDGNIIIPERVLKKGGENRITRLIQPASWQEWGRAAASASVSADLSRSAYASDQGEGPWLQIRDLKSRKREMRNLGRPMVLGGALHDTLRSLAFSPDGRQLASGHQYGSVRVWDVDVILEAKGAPKETHTIRVAPVSVVSLAFSPDGKRLATGSEDARITLLDPVSGKRIHSFIGHASDVLALAFSPDGKRLASASHDRSVKIWDTSSGKELLTLGVHAGPVYAVVYSPDGKSVATAIDASHIRLWDATTGAALRTLDAQQGDVLSLAFSPDGRRLAAGSREGVVNQWDLASGKKLTMVHRNREDARFAARDAMVTKVLYSLDGKQLFSLGIGVGRKWDSETGVGGDKFTDFGEYARPPQAVLRRPKSGPYHLAEGFGNYPVELYTSEDCDESGMNYASYAGKWDTLPDFDALTPVKKGVLKHIDPEHLSGVMLPYWKITKKDGRDHRTAQPSGLRVTGYLKVKKAGDYAFSLQSRDGSRLVVGSKTVIDNDGVKEAAVANEVKHGSLHLEPGVHSFVLTYVNAQEFALASFYDQNAGSLNFTFPDAFVRSLTVGDMDSSRLMAGALLAQGKPEEAKALLTKLHRGGWPLSDEEQVYVEQARMRIRRMARTSSPNDRSHALGLIDSSLATHPMLRLDPEFMVSVIAVYASIGDPRAAILAEQMLELEMHDGQRRLLIMTQVKIKLNEGDLPGAGKVYRRLKKLAPQSDELIEARELIKAAVIRGK